MRGAFMHYCCFHFSLILRQRRYRSVAFFCRQAGFHHFPTPYKVADHQIYKNIYMKSSTMGQKK